MNNSLTSALQLASQGFAVFPIRKNTRAPACANGCKDATLEPQTIQALFTDDFNIGIEASRSGLVLIDLDKKNGRNGIESFKTLIAKLGAGIATKTRMAKTINQGYHLYYKAPPGDRLPNSRDHPLIGVGIEVKSLNQYLVAPPSTIDGKAYEWVSEEPIADCPEWFTELCRSTAKIPKKHSDPAPEKTQSIQSTPIGKDRALLWKLFWEIYPNSVSGLSQAISDAGFAVISEDWDGIYIASPYSSEYTTPVGERDVKVYLSYGVSTFHVSDENKFWDDLPDFVQKHLPELWKHYEHERKINQQRRENKVNMEIEKPELELEIYQGASIVGEKTILNLDKHPPAIVKFVSDFARQNNMLDPVYHFGAAYAILGALIGKSIYAVEQQVLQYPNDWYAMLCPTGGTKTGPVTAITDAVININIRLLLSGGTMAGVYGQIGAYIPKKEWQSLTEEQQSFRMKDIHNKACAKTTGNVLISDECTGTLDGLMGSWDSRNPAKDISDLIKLKDSGSRNPKQTGGEAYRTWEDACVSFLGYTQNETWQNKFGSEEFKDCGLFGRFVPITSQYLSVKYTPLDGSYRQVMDETYTAASKIGKVRATFTIDGKDHIADVMEILKTEHPIGKKLNEIYPEDFQRLRSKIVVHALKSSMTEAFLRGDHLDGLSVRDTVDCSKYFGRHAAWIATAYFAYLQQLIHKSYTARDEERVMQLLRKYEAGMTVRDIQRRLHFRNASDLIQCLTWLEDDGKITHTEKQSGNRNGQKVMVYRTLRPSQK